MRVLGVLGVLRVLTVLLAAAMVVATVDGARPRQGTTIAALYAAHVDGRLDDVFLAFGSADDFRRSRSDIFLTVRDWRPNWRPSQTAFVFDLARIAFARQWEEAPQLLAAARDMAATRRTQTAEDDAFELTLHRAAVAFLLSQLLPNRAIEYLTPINISDGSAPGRARLIWPRLALVRGSVYELMSAPVSRPNASTVYSLGTIRLAANEHEARRLVEQALAQYQRIVATPDAGPEASVRAAVSLYRLDRNGEALAALSRVPPSAEPTVRYWAELVRGRVHEAEGRVSDAAAAYERAAALFPRAQTPAIALTSLWRRNDRPEEAMRLSAAALAPGQSTGPDPWRDYWMGEVRVLPSLLASLRQARP